MPLEKYEIHPVPPLSFSRDDLAHIVANLNQVAWPDKLHVPVVELESLLNKGILIVNQWGCVDLSENQLGVIPEVVSPSIFANQTIEDHFGLIWYQSPQAIASESLEQFLLNADHCILTSGIVIWPMDSQECDLYWPVDRSIASIYNYYDHPGWILNRGNGLPQSNKRPSSYICAQRIKHM